MSSELVLDKQLVVNFETERGTVKMGIFLLIVFGLGFFALFVGGKEALSYLAKLPDASFKKAAIWLAAGLVATLISGYQLIGRNLGQTIPLAFGLTILALALNMLYLHRRGRLWNIGLIVRGLTILALLILVGVNAKGAWGVLAKTMDSPKSAKATVSEYEQTVSGSASANKKAAKKKGKKEKTSDFPLITASQAERMENYGSLSWDGQKDTWPSFAQHRVRAIKAAGGPTFTDAVSVPFRNIENLKGFSKLSDEQKTAAMDVAWEELEEKIIQDPIYGHMWLQFLAKFEYITINNSWIVKNLAKLDKALLEDQGGKGWDEYCLISFKVSENASKVKITEWWYKLASRINFTLRHFERLTVEQRKSQTNWNNPEGQGSASYARTREANSQEKEYAIVIRLVDKSGDERVLAGVNIWDKRAEIFGDHLAIILPGVTPKKSNPSKTSDPGKPGDPSNPKDPSDPPKRTPTPGSTPPGTTPTPKPSDPPTGTPTPGPSDPPTGTPTPIPTDPPTNTPTPGPTKDPTENGKYTGDVNHVGGDNNGQPSDSEPTVTKQPDYVAPTNPPATAVPAPPPGNENGGPTYSNPGESTGDSGFQDTWGEQFSSDGGQTNNIVDVSPGNEQPSGGEVFGW